MITKLEHLEQNDPTLTPLLARIVTEFGQRTHDQGSPSGRPEDSVISRSDAGLLQPYVRAAVIALDRVAEALEFECIEGKHIDIATTRAHIQTISNVACLLASPAPDDQPRHRQITSEAYHVLLLWADGLEDQVSDYLASLEEEHQKGTQVSDQVRRVLADRNDHREDA